MEFRKHIDILTGYVSFDVYQDEVCLGRCSPQIANLLHKLDWEGLMPEEIKQEAAKQVKIDAWREVTS